jgi:nitric oxide synthase oxygenase domain/subunit
VKVRFAHNCNRLGWDPEQIPVAAPAYAHRAEPLARLPDWFQRPSDRIGELIEQHPFVATFVVVVLSAVAIYWIDGPVR